MKATGRCAASTEHKPNREKKMESLHILYIYCKQNGVQINPNRLDMRITNYK